MSEEAKVKVTDKRIFTPEGDLREEYRFLDEKAKAGAGAEPAAEVSDPPPPAQPSEPPRPPAEPVAAAAASEPPGRPGKPPESAGRPLEIPVGPGPMGAPSFLDLVSVLAEPVAVYLGDMKLPDGSSAENLDMARLHIDLIDVLRQKTAGNLDAREAAVLEDLLYRLRMRYVEKRG